MNNLINKIKKDYDLNDADWFPDGELDMKDIDKLVFIVTTIEKGYDDGFLYVYKQKIKQDKKKDIHIVL